MPKNLPNITYSKMDNVISIDSPTANYYIPFHKDSQYFSNLDSYTNFIKGVEKQVRTNDRYRKYIKYLKEKVGLRKCQVFSNIEITPEDIEGKHKKINVEMHHGPIFTLYDYCAIILNYYLEKGWKISTFRIAKTVLDEHMKNHIQVVMLSTTAHEEVHNREIFINYKQAFGDLNAFIRKYGDVFSYEQKDKLNRYIDRCIVEDSNDYGIFELSDALLHK